MVVSGIGEVSRCSQPAQLVGPVVGSGQPIAQPSPAGTPASVPIRTRDHCVKAQPAIDHFRQRPDRHLAASTHLVQQGALARGGKACRVVIQEDHVPLHGGVVLANFNCQRALTRRRTHQLRRKHLPYGFPLARRFSPAAARITASIDIAGLKLPQAGVHISAQGMNVEIGTQRLQLCLPPQAAGADPSPVGQFFNAVVLARAENIARILARGDGDDFESRRDLCGQVLQAVRRQINPLSASASSISLVNIPWSPWARATSVILSPGGFDDFNFDVVPVLLKQRLDVTGLP